MGEIKDFVDLLKEIFKFYGVVHEFEQGILFRNGIAVERKVKWFGEDLEEIVEEEQQVIKEHGGKWNLFLDYISRREHKFPEGWGRKLLGFPKHKKRYEKSKNLFAGNYRKLPEMVGIDFLITDVVRDEVRPIPEAGVLTSDVPPIPLKLRGNMKFQLSNFYKAYTKVKNWRESIIYEAQSALSQYGAGKPLTYWQDPASIRIFEKTVLDSVRELVSEEKWGVKIHEIRITHAVPASFQDISYHGPPLAPKLNEQDDKLEPISDAA